MSFWARKSVLLQELNRQAKRQVALTAATGVAVRRNQLNQHVACLAVFSPSLSCSATLV